MEGRSNIISVCFVAQISVDRGMPWMEALQKIQNLSNPDEGFYLSHKVSI